MARKRVYKGHNLVENVDDYTVLDIETTSLDSYYGEILEISAIKVRNKKEIEYFSELIKINNEVGLLYNKINRHYKRNDRTRRKRFSICFVWI